MIGRFESVLNEIIAIFRGKLTKTMPGRKNNSKTSYHRVDGKIRPKQLAKRITCNMHVVHFTWKDIVTWKGINTGLYLRITPWIVLKSSYLVAHLEGDPTVPVNHFFFIHLQPHKN